VKRSDKYITKVNRELKGSVRAIAQRIGYTETGTYRALRRLGLRK
jgi:hypothetical protein